MHLLRLLELPDSRKDKRDEAEHPTTPAWLSVSLRALSGVLAETSDVGSACKQSLLVQASDVASASNGSLSQASCIKSQKSGTPELLPGGLGGVEDCLWKLAICSLPCLRRSAANSEALFQKLICLSMILWLFQDHHIAMKM